jgi:sugar/nucleoside kinase (ribokinase family)
MNTLSKRTIEAAIIRDLFERANKPVLLLGDFCLDAYWEIDPSRSEPSLETDLPTQPVLQQRYALGGAGNVLANLCALQAAPISCIGVVGDDLFGDYLAKLLHSCNGDAPSLIWKIPGGGYQTPVYCKPMLAGQEQPRFDLGVANDITEAIQEEIFRALCEICKNVKVLAINQQLKRGLHQPYLRRRLADYLASQPDITAIYDGRDYLDAYPAAVLKLNARAASRLAFAREDAPPLDVGEALLRRYRKPVIITDGANGCYVFELDLTTHIPALPCPGPVDGVGAGDSFLAGLALGYAASRDWVRAAQLGCCCSAVTVRKIGQTGSASPEEIAAVINEQ